MKLIRIVPLLLVTVCCQAQTFSVVYTFLGGQLPANPHGGLSIGPSGTLYGTTEGGGQDQFCAVYQLGVSGQLVVLHSFSRGSEGIGPDGTPVLASNGDLYGTTGSAGIGQVPGTAWRLSKTGTFQTLHIFNYSILGDGTQPNPDIILDHRSLYGTTTYAGGSGYGGVFKIGPSGYEEMYHSFHGSDGAFPGGSVVSDENGNLYGTTLIGGAMDYGTVYKIDRSGTASVLHDFAQSDGEMPLSDVTRDAQGNLYGTTLEGGSFSSGVIFRISSAGVFTVLHNFGEVSGDGYLPETGVVVDDRGHLYGTTSNGGAQSNGTVYELDLNTGVYTILHSFTGGSDGRFPFAGVTLDRAGNLYGTASAGGDPGCGCGVIFKIVP